MQPNANKDVSDNSPKQPRTRKKSANTKVPGGQQDTGKVPKADQQGSTQKRGSARDEPKRHKADDDSAKSKAPKTHHEKQEQPPSSKLKMLIRFLRENRFRDLAECILQTIVAGQWHKVDTQQDIAAGITEQMIQDINSSGMYTGIT